MSALLANMAGWSLLQWLLWAETMTLVVLLLRTAQANARQRALIGHIDQVQHALMLCDEVLDWYSQGNSDGGRRARQLRIELWG